MNTLTRFLLLVVMYIGLHQQLTFAQTITPDEARQDLSYLKRKLDQLHPGMGFYTPQARMEQLYDSLYNRLTAPMDYMDFFHHVSPLVTALKDGHTNLNHRRNYIDRHTRFIPFFIRPVGEQYYVSHNVSADTTLRRGTELLTINNRSVADIHRELMEHDHSGSDGDNLTGRRQWSLVQFADYYAAWFGSADSISVTYRFPDDSLIRETRLRCPTLNGFRTTLSKRYQYEIDNRPNLSVRIVDTLTRTAVLRVSTFMGMKKMDPFQRVFNRRLKQAFREIKRQNIQNLVVDMQGNGGGIVMNSARLLRYWMPGSFSIMEHEEMKRDARAELVARWNPLSALNFSMKYRPTNAGGFVSRSARYHYRPLHRKAFTGNLYFLMNGASFSATTSVLAKTLNAGMGTFVGEASGSAYWGDFAGHFKTVTLPNSRIHVRIPLKKLTHAVVADRANGFTVEPDFAVSRSYDDLLTNRDYILAYTLKLIREGVVVRHGLDWPGSDKRHGKNSPLQASR